MLSRINHTFASAYRRDANNFDFLRFALASLVIWSHCFPLSGRPMDWFYAASRQTDGGSLAVECFFVLSGFLITQSWTAQPRLGAYARKRALRILPAMIAAMAFGAFFIGPLVAGLPVSQYLSSAGPWLHFLGVLVPRFLRVPSLFVGNPVPYLLNSPLWSLRYELFCYALVPLLGARRVPPRLMSTIALFVICWVYYAGHPDGDTIVSMTARLVACFSAGMVLYLLREHVPYSAPLAGVASAVLMLTFFTFGFRQAFPVAGSYLLLFAAFSSRLPLHNFARYGDFSYGLFVFAYPIQQTIVWFFGPQIPLGVFFAAAFAAALIVAVLSWRLIEAPALARKHGAHVRRPAVVRSPEEAVTA
jgi:peptidoglycan/LPS O-acetylase OafA/YrhL